jgi:TPP-dependent pyruvate/acetoin dehydrogenase alpha subunit
MEEQAKTEADERMDRALEAAEAHSISPDAFFDHLYSEPTPRMERQRAQLLEALERKGSSDA